MAMFLETKIKLCKQWKTSHVKVVFEMEELDVVWTNFREETHAER